MMQVDLTRTVRFCLGSQGQYDQTQPRANTFASWPPMDGLGRYYELHILCRGEVDRETGYFINIKTIDTAVREEAIPLIAKACRTSEPGLGLLMQELLNALQPPLDQTVRQISLQLTPTYAISLEAETMNQVLIRQQFEFSAAHRLHVPSLSDAENINVFGKCNNPSGHGHNYRFETVIATPIDEAGHITPLSTIEQLIDEVIVERFDHKHLNVDTEEFAQLNPSVENIAKVIHDLLGPALQNADGSMYLQEVTVWETGKTCCTYRRDTAAPER